MPSSDAAAHQATPIVNLGCTPLPKRFDCTSRNASVSEMQEGNPEVLLSGYKNTTSTPSVFSTPFSPTTDSFFKYVNESENPDEQEISLDEILDDSSEPKGEDLMSCLEDELTSPRIIEEDTVSPPEAPLQTNESWVEAQEPPAKQQAVSAPSPLLVPSCKEALLHSTSVHNNKELFSLAMATLCTFGVVVLTLSAVAYMVHHKAQLSFESVPSSM